MLRLQTQESECAETTETHESVNVMRLQTHRSECAETTDTRVNVLKLQTNRSL